MSYELTLEKAGATVLESKGFGSYQGDWFAIVNYKGKLGVVRGAYGSCSGCDAFQAEFGCYDADACFEHRYKPESARVGCEWCVEAKKSYDRRLAEFGEGYLPPDTFESAISYAKSNIDWDYDAILMVEWLEQMQEKHKNS